MTTHSVNSRNDGSNLIFTLNIFYNYTHFILIFINIIKGEEKCQWAETKSRTYTDSEGKSQTEYYTEYYYGGREIIHNVFSIYKFMGGTAMPGQYTFPFCITIPYFHFKP